VTLISPRSVRLDVCVLVALEGAIIDQSQGGGGTMPPIVLTIEIARPPDEVFSYVTDPSRFAEWQQEAARGRREGGGPPGVDSRFTTTRRIGRASRSTSTSRATGSASCSCRSSAGWDARTVPRTVGTSRNGSRAAISRPRATYTSMRSSRTRLLGTSLGSPDTSAARAHRKRETYA
jgi:Polyketide cyclase / dehydrase and lipid transport